MIPEYVSMGVALTAAVRARMAPGVFPQRKDAERWLQIHLKAMCSEQGIDYRQVEMKIEWEERDRWIMGRPKQTEWDPTVTVTRIDVITALGKRVP